MSSDDMFCTAFAAERGSTIILLCKSLLIISNQRLSVKLFDLGGLDMIWMAFSAVLAFKTLMNARQHVTLLTLA